MLLIIAGIFGIALFYWALRLISVPVEGYTFKEALKDIVICIFGAIGVLVAIFILILSVVSVVTGLEQVLG